MQTQDRTGEANALFHHIGKRNEVDLGVCASTVADKVIGDPVCERGQTLNHGVHVWPLDITKREKYKFDI
jgi:hypothetical protein